MKSPIFDREKKRVEDDEDEEGEKEPYAEVTEEWEEEDPDPRLWRKTDAD